MRTITTKEITKIVQDLVIDTALYLRPDVLRFYQQAIKKETNPRVKFIFEQLIKNAKLAKKNKVPYCQDTGLEIIYCEIGQDIHITGGSLEKAIQSGVKQASKAAYLRQSIVNDPILRENTQTNTPALIHYKIVPGAKIKFTCLAKGFGCENKGAVKMLNPTADIHTIKETILEIIKNAGANACPPFLVGIGLGGTMDKACSLAKEAICQPLGKRHAKAHLAELEEDLTSAANKLNLGPLGFGGKTTVMDVKIKEYATHIAGLPVAVNIGCHAVRSKSITV
jgi:fumarate hydratase subunit alpha